ncbi:hypothetical protein [Bacillus piscicola]|uniref:hypothetical protein n=1 Tax=Bacillus piscicola TaxID=1632684 RepID=UPI001F09EFDE|nr:hypothetical protein [Bacillus piscicola]
MIGLLISEKEAQELKYALKKELEEMLVDLEEEKEEETVRKVIKEKYRIVFGLYRRIAAPDEAGSFRNMLKHQ